MTARTARTGAAGHPAAGVMTARTARTGAPVRRKRSRTGRRDLRRSPVVMRSDRLSVPVLPRRMHFRTNEPRRSSKVETGRRGDADRARLGGRVASSRLVPSRFPAVGFSARSRPRSGPRARPAPRRSVPINFCLRSDGRGPMSGPLRRGVVGETWPRCLRAMEGGRSQLILRGGRSQWYGGRLGRLNPWGGAARDVGPLATRGGRRSRPLKSAACCRRRHRRVTFTRPFIRTLPGSSTPRRIRPRTPRAPRRPTSMRSTGHRRREPRTASMAQG